MKPAIRWLAASFGASRIRDIAAAYRQCFLGDRTAGRLVLQDLARYCRAGQSSFVSGDPHQTAFNEGARDVYLHIHEILGLGPADFLTKIEEE